MTGYSLTVAAGCELQRAAHVMYYANDDLRLSWEDR